MKVDSGSLLTYLARMNRRPCMSAIAPPSTSNAVAGSGTCITMLSRIQARPHPYAADCGIRRQTADDLTTSAISCSMPPTRPSPLFRRSHAT
jgi:hypothetical protein